MTGEVAPVPLLSRLFQRKLHPSVQPAFLIFCPPRSGSANLQVVLSRHPQIHNEGEVFNPAVLAGYAPESPIPPLVSSHPRRLARLLQTVRRESAKPVVGLKLLYTSLSEREQHRLLTNGFKVVHLYRNDLFAQAVSYAFAFRSKVWHLEQVPSEEQIEELRHSPLTLPAEELESNIEFIERKFAWTRRLLNKERVPHLELDYETLSSSPDQTLARVQTFLGVDLTPLDPNYFPVKTRDGLDYPTSIANYQELRRRFSGRRLTS